MARDLIGYGLSYPKIRWPDGARVAVSLVLNYEEGAEMSVGDGDPTGERLGEVVSPVKGESRDLGTESSFEYGSRAGTRRVLRLFADYGVRATIYACGRALERHPEQARAFTAAGHEMAGHGYRWTMHHHLDRDQEREEILKAVASIKKASGERPVGWYTRFTPTPHTRELLLEEGGFLYDSDSYADELPYWVMVGERKHLVIPYQLDANDFKFFHGTPGWAASDAFYEYLRDSVTVLLKEGKTEPKMLSIGLHGRIIGRPGRSVALERFLEFCKETPGIWLARRVEIANWWKENYP